ncbi:hypothetical protein ACFPC0_10840 [Streptomyces andamanensis]|uniref:2OGFeDO JBP1/TET oxygenase domain-containing protein n=1 Tax=Streptomyces andamanensis TaxID=1565035 RepID=A0ABV8TCM3_9ACTN
MIEARLRTRISSTELESKVGKILGPQDYNALLTGPAKLLKPNGQPLVVYLPGALQAEADTPAVYATLHSLRSLRTDNRGTASGSRRITRPGSTRSRALNVPSAIIGAFDAAGAQKYCRLTAWTGQNLPQWETLRPFLQAIAHHFKTRLPDRYAVQMAEVERTFSEWVVPDTPFTTVTVNNTYPTGVHQDAGDLESGFSTLACIRRGTFTGGQLVFPKYRVAIDMQHGDLALIDAHEYHGNTAIVCACGERRNGMCDTCGAERISVVSYFRQNMTRCGSYSEEAARAATAAETRNRKRLAAQIDAADTPAEVAP